MVPFRGCYNTNGSGNCEDSDNYPNGSIVPLTNVTTTLHNGINALTGNGGSGTNLCEGLTQTRLKLFQAGVSRPNASKFIILLTDADNNYSTTASFAACRPSSGGNADYKVNLLTYNLAQAIKNGTNVGSSGQPLNKTVKIFVIFYGSNPTVPPNCTAPGSGVTASTGWDTPPVNLGRCIASSAGDMYIAPTPAAVYNAFLAIISRLPVRLLT
jgi:hypothetical protein